MVQGRYFHRRCNVFNVHGNHSCELQRKRGRCERLFGLKCNYTITNAPPPVATITNAGSSVLCAGDSTTLSAPSGMSAYLWSNGEITSSITTSTAANYSVTVTNVDGCSATSAATAITTSSIITPMITSNGTSVL